VIHDNASHLIDKISAAAGEPLEVQELILAHTMRTSRQFLGIEEPNLSTTDTDFYAAYDSSRQGIMIRTALNNVYWLYNTRKFRLACQYTRNVANTSVRRVLAMPTSFQTEQSEKRNILEELVMHTRDPDRLSTMALDLLFAGRQTSASFVSSMLFYLARNPTIYAKLRQHVIQDFGKEATDDLIGFEDLKRCKYLQWCMNEALRLMPAVSFGTLTATEDVILPRGGGPQGKAPIFVSKACRR
jgi:cytochrome P450